MASTSIPAEKIVRLIELIQSEECMWDMRSAVYHDRNKKRSVVQTIAETLELQGKVSSLPKQFTRAAQTSNCCGLSQLMSTTHTCCVHPHLLILYFRSHLVVCYVYVLFFSTVSFIKAMCICSRKWLVLFTELYWVRSQFQSQRRW